MEENKVMSLADFCNFNKKVERITIRSGAVMGREIEQPGVIRKTTPAERLPGGTDYAKPYIEEEERLLLQGHKFDMADLAPDLPGHSRVNFWADRMEEVTSIGSVPNLADVDDQDSIHVYDNYDFTPKETNLPIQSKKDDIIRMIDTNQVLIILGSTGCGKTTQVPQFILDHHAQQRKRCNIIVTQPRRIAATSVANRVCDERHWELSTIVGYQIGLDNKTSPDTRLTYCTTGVMREKLVRERNMMAYTHVIIDEVHERDIETDFLMLIVKQLLRTNSNKVKVILMSATIDPFHFARYFALPLGNDLVSAPVLEVEKATNYDIKIFHIEQLIPKLGTGVGMPEFELDNPEVHEEAINIAANLISFLDKLDPEEWKAKNYKPSALVFLPGIHEIETLHDRLHQISKEKNYLWSLIPLHSSITKEEQRRVFYKPKPGYRKVILSTNIAESSITVDDVVYVIDFCLTKHLICDQVTNFTSLRYSWASQSNCKQRAGRCGRVTNGRVYRLVPRDFFEVLPVEADPEMIRCPLTQTVLKAKLLKMGDPKAILAKALNPPDLTRLETTILLLKEAGALLLTSDGEVSKFDGDITFLGYVMSHLPLDIQLSKLIMLGNVFSILEDTIAIAAWMSVRNVFKSDFYDRLGPYSARIFFTGGSSSDCIAYLHVYRTYKEKWRNNYFKTSNDSETSWCRRNFLDFKALKEADELVDELRNRLKNLGVFESVSDARARWEDDQLPIIRKVVIAGAFYPNYFVRSSLGGQVCEKDAVKVLNGKDPCSTVYLSGLPPLQPGQLYSKVFADILGEYCGAVSNVSFDGSSKVYVEFERERNKNLPGKISYPVYKAIKMRQLKIPIDVPILSVQEAEKRMKKYGEAADRYLCIGKLKAPPKDRLPGISVDKIKFVPCHVDDPNKFWIHNEIAVELKSVQIKLNTPGNTFALDKKPVLGGIYAAPYPRNSEILYRAQISAIEQQSQTATIKYIDYGNVEHNMPLKLLYDIGPSMQDLKMAHIVPPFALECTLTGVGPSSIKNANDIWSALSINNFKKMMACGELLGEIFSVVDGVISMTVTQDGNQESVNKMMIEQGFAVEVEESFRSKSNNFQRILARNNGVSQGSQQQCQRTLILDDMSNTIGRVVEYIDPPTRQECRQNRPVRMRGPISPLEMRVYGCTNVSSGKEVSMDVESVNSVLLDSNPEDPHERLLVAGFVRTNSAGSKLKVGHSTLMPNIHGLSSLMCLIFSPQAELRLSKDKQRYIGALCGLGYDKTTGSSFFPENEMEITFDCLIDEQDMMDINGLRYWMSTPLRIAEGNDEACEATPADILKAQQGVHKFLFKLLSRPRPSQEVEHFRFTYEWHRYDDNDYLQPDHHLDRAVFQAHHALAMRE